jgi:cation diffusion facilitator family transporter
MTSRPPGPLPKGSVEQIHPDSEMETCRRMDTRTLETQADREKRSVALSSVMAAILLTGTKVVVGFATGSLGILSEALHSGLDLLAALLTFFAVRVSGRPADREHPYGHGKVENLSALLQTVLLLATCFWIVWEAVQRLFFKPVEVKANPWAFLVVLLSLVVDWSRSRALSRTARKHGSAALEADALHFSTDLWSSGVVLVGLILLVIARATGLKWLEAADSVAALLVAGIVVWVGWRLGKQNVDALLDSVRPEDRLQVAQRAAAVPGVQEVRKVRMRRSGTESFVDLTLTVDRGLPLERAHDIALAAEDAVRHALPRADVVVHVVPVPGESEGILDTVRLAAMRRGLGAHNIVVHDDAGHRTIELHLEVKEDLSLDDADRAARVFEHDLRFALPEIESVLLHLEPAGDSTAALATEPAEVARVYAALRPLPVELSFPFRPHEVQVRDLAGVLSVSFRCIIGRDVSLPEAHRWSEEIERRLRARMPELGRVTIRMEPAEGFGD